MLNLKAALALVFLSLTANAAEPITIQDGEMEDVIAITVTSVKPTRANEPRKICVEKSSLFGCIEDKVVYDYSEEYIAKDLNNKTRFSFNYGKKGDENSGWLYYTYITSRGKSFKHGANSSAGFKKDTYDKIVQLLETSSKECPVTISIARKDGAIKNVRTACDSMD